MFKAVSTFVAVAGTAAAQSYYQAPVVDPYAPPQPAPYQPVYQQQQAYYPTVTEFKKTAPIVDPKYYQDVLSDFKQCNAHKCQKLGRGYSTDIKESISILGAYTSCVTACAAEESLKVIVELKNNLAKLYDIGMAQLVLARKHVGGDHDYDVLEQATSIGDSCCLPDDYFTSWDRLVLPVTLRSTNRGETFEDASSDGDDTSSIDRMISIPAYLARCSGESSSVATSGGPEWLSAVGVECDRKLVTYLELLKHNLLHLVLEPKCEQLAPEGACHKRSVNNPRSRTFNDDVCIARQCSYNGYTEEVEIPLLKKITPSNHWYQSCPDDVLIDYTESSDDNVQYVFKYERVPRKDIPYFALAGGLPSSTARAQSNIRQALAAGNPDALGHCRFDQGLSKDRDVFETQRLSEGAIEAAKVCPYGGLFEYCNMRQYASYLQSQLFDNDDCQVADMKNVHADQPQYFGTLACLYKVTTLKCDCMEAVLNCYEREFHFTEALAKTIGKAASILCGFLLCQRPNVYSLFGGESAIEKANIVRALLSQVGVAVPDMATVPPATFAFLSFGVGMVAFVAVKQVAKKSSRVNSDDGYRSLI